MLDQLVNTANFAHVIGKIEIGRKVRGGKKCCKRERKVRKKRTKRGDRNAPDREKDSIQGNCHWRSSFSCIVQLMSRTEKALLTVSRIKERKRKRKGRTFPQIGEKK